ncbi:hypothetical protein H632_c145p1 [Helicosporidium sp. ATCC 50920]|nr:hypothetical protein H632_c145p1 [Helicosporidium sp. ATCC 50920]|eukprot:KDD76661.1 hypothetical protein H632_c145p1 [Helicosporidium sp. ATCC 50920]
MMLRGAAHGAAAQPKHLAESTPLEATLSWAPPLFPELAEAQTRCVLVGIDPDLSGALAVLTWRNGVASGVEAQDLAGMTVRLHDVPIEMVKLTTRERRQHCGERLFHMLQAAGREEGAGGEAQTSEEPSSEQSSNLSHSTSPDVVRRGVLEMTAPAHMSGKHAWFTMGYAAGLLDGLFRACGLPYRRVHAATWKRDLGLFGAGKEGSMLLAKKLFPQAEPMLA